VEEKKKEGMLVSSLFQENDGRIAGDMPEDNPQ